MCGCDCQVKIAYVTQPSTEQSLYAHNARQSNDCPDGQTKAFTFVSSVCLRWQDASSTWHTCRCCRFNISSPEWAFSSNWTWSFLYLNGWRRSNVRAKRTVMLIFTKIMRFSCRYRMYTSMLACCRQQSIRLTVTSEDNLHLQCTTNGRVVSHNCFISEEHVKQPISYLKTTRPAGCKH